MTTDTVIRYRAVGKLTFGHRHPTHTIGFLDEQDAIATAQRLIYSGIWSEFYIKKVYAPAGGIQPAQV